MRAAYFLVVGATMGFSDPAWRDAPRSLLDGHDAQDVACIDARHRGVLAGMSSDMLQAVAAGLHLRSDELWVLLQLGVGGLLELTLGTTQPRTVRALQLDTGLEGTVEDALSQMNSVCKQCNSIIDSNSLIEAEPF